MFTVLFFLIALLSEIVGTVAGFGSSVFFVPLAGFFFDFHQVLALTSILHVSSNAAKLAFFGRHVQLRLLLLLGLPSVAAVITGAYLSTKLQLKFDQLVLGLFLIAFSFFLLLEANDQNRCHQMECRQCWRCGRIFGWTHRYGRGTSGLGLSGFRLGKRHVRRDFRWDRFRRGLESNAHLSPQWLSRPKLNRLYCGIITDCVYRIVCWQAYSPPDRPEIFSQNCLGLRACHRLDNARSGDL